jgi:hypothetical protein
MKKMILLAMFAISFVSSAKAQKELFSCTFNGGYTHMADPKIQCGAFGAYMGFMQFYFGVQFKPASMATSLDVGKWGGQTQIYTYHVGYRIPLHYGDYGITPIAGVTNGAHGWVDGNDWRYDETYGVVNKFHATDQRIAPDFGVMFDWARPRVQGFGLKFCATVTLHTASIGIGFYM